MINAKEAWAKTLLRTMCKELMDRIEKSIFKAIERGKSESILDISDKDTAMVHSIIIPELENLGYKAVYRPAEPMPLGCPSDQWYSTNTLTISWEEVNDND